jgi:DNA topoisomerase-1
VSEHTPDHPETAALVEEFSKLYVTSSALEEVAGNKLNALSPAQIEKLRHTLELMRNHKLTFSKALLAVDKGVNPASPPAVKTPKASTRKTSSKALSAVDKGVNPARPSAVKTPKTSTRKPSTTPAKPKAAKRLSPTQEALQQAIRAGKGQVARLKGKDNLLIVESPAKAKTIKKFLGGDFVVKASMGHVRDIPNRGFSRSDIGIDFDNHYQPYYVPIESRDKVIKELRTAVAKAKHVYLAPDPDREGEAIAWHLKELLGVPDDQVSRVTFNAITKSAIQDAMKHLSSVNMNLVNAQQGRRVLDRIVGYRLSPFLWKKVAKGLSAGRVQSVAVRIVAEREEEIRAFNPVEYWRLRATLTSQPEDNSFLAELVSWQDKPFVLASGDKSTSKTPSAPDAATATAIQNALAKARYQVESVSERTVNGRPSPPFITSSLQQSASNVLHLGAQRTMRIAQQLYEGIELADGNATGLITYMRTDSTRIAPEAISEVRDYIGKNFKPAYLPDQANFYASRKGAQDAHEAIRPTSVFITPESVHSLLTPEQFRLYDLIWRRFVACQLSPAEFKITTARIKAGEGIFEAKGRVVVFDGHTVLYAAGKRKKKEEGESEGGKEEDEQLLPELKATQELALQSLEPSQHFTQPPGRFSEASLVRELEKAGIGRPSTYAPIVQTIQDRGYVRQENRRFFATRLGLAVNSILTENFPDILDRQFTAQMEADLDRVEEGEVKWDQLVDSFYQPFHQRLDAAMENSQPLKGAPAPNGEKCPLCDADMTLRYSQRGAFLSCSRYPECSGTREIPGEDGLPADAAEDMVAVNCPDCGLPMIRKRSRFGMFLACSGYPNCKRTLPLDRTGRPVELPDIKRDCEKCGRPMLVKSGRRGPFLACSGYPECKNTKHIDKNGAVVDLPEVVGEKCDKCGADMVVRMGRRGPFLACSAYPKCRNSRPLEKEVETVEK